MRKIALVAAVAVVLVLGSVQAIAQTHAVIISPDPAEFFDTRTGQQSEVEITLTNGRSQSTFILWTNVTNDPIFTIEQEGSGNKCIGTTLEVGGTCTFKLYFNPDIVSRFTAKLSVYTWSWEFSDSVEVTGHGTAPTLTVEPRELNFGKEIVNTDSEPRFINIANTGTDLMTIVGISPDPGFSLVDALTTCPTEGGTLDPGDDCEVWILFHPTEVIIYDAYLAIETDATDLPYDLPLTGEGVEQTNVIINLSTDSLDFGNVEVGQQSAAQTVTVTNNGTATATITSIITTDDEDFNIEPNTCGATLAAADSCSFGIVFDPQNIERVQAQAQVTDDAADSPQDVTLRGVGIFDGTPDINISVRALDFGEITVNTYSDAQTVTITNNGTSALTISRVALAGEGEQAYGMATTCLNATIAVGGSCTVGAVFEPMANGTYAAGITITSDAASGAEQTITLTGTGIGGEAGSSGSCSVTPGAPLSGGIALVFGAIALIISRRRMRNS